MKNKEIRKGIAAVCMGLAVLSAPSSAVMANVPEQIQPMAEYIRSYEASLNISSNGVATVKASVTPSGNYNTSVSAKLQRRTTNGWEDVRTWSASGKGGRTSVYETCDVSKGTYRVYAIVKAGSETRYPISATRTY